jgi:hypothetical protein
MHIISEERALAHWRTLCCVPPAIATRLTNRFLTEQPALVGTILTLCDGTMEDQDGKPVLRPDDDPGMADFKRLVEAAAQLAEIFRREAGRALRKMERAEATELIDTYLALFLRFKEAKERGGEIANEIFDAFPQPNLFGGVVTALGSAPNARKDRAAVEALILRLTIEGLHRACGGDATPDSNDWDAERVLIALSGQGDPMRHAALAASERFRAELTPELIAELRWWASDPKEALEEDGSLGMHALYLLAKWRETSAWPACRDLLLLPGQTSEDLLGDFITEDASIVLAMVAGGMRDELRTMVENERVDEFCRTACLDALACQVAWGECPRSELVTYLRELLTGRLRNSPRNEHVFGGVVSAACDLEAWELLPEIQGAYQRGAVDEFFMDLDYVRESAAGKHPGQWQDFCQKHAPVDDVALRTKWLDEAPEKPDPLPTLPEGRVVAEGFTPFLAPPKVGRNDPCPCGSGKKFKKCCGG